MAHTVAKAVISAFLLQGLPVGAQVPAGEMTGSEMARLVTESPLPSDCLAPVVINRIDGAGLVAPGKGFLLEPGIHAINGLAILDTTKCQHLEGELEITNTADLEVNFEAGKTYYIAYDRTSPNPGDWKLVVWKVEQISSPEDQSEQKGG